MSPADLQNKLIKRIQEILSGFPLDTGYNNTKPFRVLKQNLPERLVETYDYRDEAEDEQRDDLYPFVVVRLSNGIKQDNPSTLDNVVQLIIGVRNEDFEGGGFDDALSAMQEILNDFDRDPLIDRRYVLKYPVSWSTTDDSTYPYFYIGVETTWESHTFTNLGGMHDV